MAANEAFVLELADVDETERLGAVIARTIADDGCVIFLKGELGVGKTSLVRGLLRELAYTGPVKSPTYNLLEEYFIAGRDIIHFDLYRLTDPEELDLIGIRDYFNGTACCLIEWPERGESSLPREDLQVTLVYLDRGRRASLVAYSDKGREMLRTIRTEPGQESG